MRSPSFRDRQFHRILRSRQTRQPSRASDPSQSLVEKDRLIHRVAEEARCLIALRVDATDPSVRHALAVIHERLFDPALNATEVVAAALPNPRQRLRFVRATGQGVRAYIEDARLLVAARLLSYADVEIYLISDAVGYDHYATFSRAFLRHLGRSPSDYRSDMLALMAPPRGGPAQGRRRRGGPGSSPTRC